MYTKPFVLASVANFLFFTNLNVYTLLPLYIQALGGREGQIGTIMAMHSVAAVLCQAGIGPLLDRWGRKPFMLLAAGLVVVTSVAYAASTALGWHLYLLRFLQGVAFSVFITSNLTLIADLAPASRRAEAVGIFGVSGLVTIALAPAIGEMVLQAWGFRTLFVASIIVAAGTLAVCTAIMVPAAAEVSGSFQGFGPGFWPTFLPVLTAAFQFGLANSIVFVFFPPFARQVGLPRIGPFYLMYAVVAIVVRFLGGRLADRFGRRQVILPSLVALAAGVLLFSILHSTWLMLVIALINGASQGFVYPATSALAFDRAPSGARGRALAAYNMAALAGGALGAIGFGWMAELLGYRQGFVVAGLILVAGALLFWRKR